MFYLAILLEFIAGFLLGPYAKLRPKLIRRMAEIKIEDELQEIQDNHEVQKARDNAALTEQRMIAEREQMLREAEDLSHIRKIQMETQQRERLQRAQDDADIQAERLEIERLKRLAETRAELSEARKAIEEAEAVNENEPPKTKRKCDLSREMGKDLENRKKVPVPDLHTVAAGVAAE